MKQPTSTTRRAFCLTTILMLGTFVYGIMARGFGITLACMANDTDTITTTNRNENTVSSQGDSVGRFSWNNEEQAHLVAAFNWGAFAGLPVAGFVATPMNSVALLTIMVALTTLVVGLFPIATLSSGYSGAVAMRVLAGVISSLISPAVDQIVAIHIPKTWKTLCYAFITIGSYIAAVVATFTGGVFCELNIAGGWPLVFYGGGAFGTVWCLAWIFFAHFTPGCLFSVEEAERVEAVSILDKIKVSFEDMKKRLPEFRDSVLKTGAFWSLMPCVVAATFTTSLFMNYIPTFFRKVMLIPMRRNGFYSALPFIVIICGIFTFSLLADCLKKGSIHTGNKVADWFLRPSVTSKTLNTIGFTCSGIIIALSTILPNMQADSAAALLALGAGMYTAVYPGYRINIVTLNRRCASIVGACATAIGDLAAIAFPYVQDLIVRDLSSLHDWRVLFCFIAVFDFVSAVVFVIFGPGDPRSEPLGRKLDGAELVMLESGEIGKETVKQE